MKAKKKLRKLVSREMLRHLQDRPGDTQVRIEVPGRNGFVKFVTLDELRQADEIIDKMKN